MFHDNKNNFSVVHCGCKAIKNQNMSKDIPRIYGKVIL